MLDIIPNVLQILNSKRFLCIHIVYIQRSFHLAFAPNRINPKREFFQIEAEQAIAMLELMITEDVTPNHLNHKGSQTFEGGVLNLIPKHLLFTSKIV